MFHATNCRAVRHCRSDCCKPRSQAPGIAAAALIVIGAGITVHKIGHALAEIAHVVVNVLLLIVLTAGAIAAAAIAVWLTVWLVRWRQRRRTGRHSQLTPVSRTGRSRLRLTQQGQRCLACGGGGQVLRADAAGHFQLRACPECQPARLAG